MTQTTAPFVAAAASYPPAYNAPGARLERAYPRYIKARVRDDKPLANFTRALIDATIDAAVRDLKSVATTGNCGESVSQAGSQS